MNWHGQINRTIWEIQEMVAAKPDHPRYRRELLRAHFLQNFEFDKAFHVPRDDRSFLFLHDNETPAALLIHGAQGTPAEMRDLGNHLYSKGFSVYCPRLSRADTKERMVSWESWVTTSAAALETMATFSRNTFVVGLSLGATIAMILSRLSPEVRGAALLAPALYPRTSFKNRIYNLGRIITPTLFYHLAGWSGEVLKAMDYARKNVSSIEVPVLALQAADDRHLSHRGLKFVRRHCTHSDTDATMLPHGSHVLTRGAAKDDVFQRVEAFISAHAVADPPPHRLPERSHPKDDASGTPDQAEDAA